MADLVRQQRDDSPLLTELGKRVETEIGLRRKQLEVLLGSEAAAKRFCRTLVIASEARKPNGDLLLAKCSVASIIQSALSAASIGLEVGGPRSHAALVPYGDSAKLLIMVAGWRHVAKRDGAIMDAQTILVREGESFRWRPTQEPPVEHEPSWGLEEPGEVVASYVILTLPGGLRLVDVVPGYYLAKVEQFARKKAGDRSTPWDEWRDQMLEKTALRKVLSRHLDPARVSEVDRADSAVEPAPTLRAEVETPAPREIETREAEPRRRARVEAAPVAPSGGPTLERERPAPTQPQASTQPLADLYRNAGREGFSRPEVGALLTEAGAQTPESATPEQIEAVRAKITPREPGADG